MEELLKISIKDFEEDFEEIQYLYKDLQSKLSIFIKEIESKKNHIPTFNQINLLAVEFYKDLSTNINDIGNDLRKINTSNSQKDLIYFQNKKFDYFNILRYKVNFISALITSTDYQSPTFNFSKYSLAGNQTGKIVHTISDYKRDIHLDEKKYESKFLKEYINIFFKLPIHAYTVNSGMAAFITIINFLITENRVKDNILIGKSIYFQNKEIVKRFFGNKVIEVDENDEDEIINKIEKHKPTIIIFDTICNSVNLAMPNLPKIIDYITKNIKNGTCLIIDNTTLPIFFQPFKLVKGKNKRLSLFVLESLNKYHEFGMDRTTGGIIIGYGKNVGKIYYTRQNSGTNITDISVHMLPTPNKKFLSKRLLRLERNTKLLSVYLQNLTDTTPNSKIKKINYPALSNHKSYSWNKNVKFHGSFFSLEFKSTKNPRIYKKFQNHLINVARKEKVQISAGTSFGFNNTRIYLTSLKSDYGTPFIRISVGTESMYELEKIKKVFKKSFITF